MIASSNFFPQIQTNKCRNSDFVTKELRNQCRHHALQILSISTDDGPELVRGFYQQFKMKNPVVMGNAKTGELYEGVLGLIGAVGISVIEREVTILLRENEALAC